MQRALCFGYGYVAQRWGASLKAVGWTVTGTSRAPSSQRIVFDGSVPIDTEELFKHSHILVSIPPDPQGDLTYRAHSQALLDHPNLQWLGYLSSTSVYGDHKGAWVDEKTECHPSDDIGRNRLLAEKQWIELYHKNHLPIHIFRLAGIYGPGRSLVDRIKAGTTQRIHKTGQYFSRIHVEDIVQVLRASMQQPNPGTIYNVADNEPYPPDALIEYVCDQLKLPYPPLVDYDSGALSPMVRHFYQDNRRVCNDKIKQELGIHLLYPTFREGLAAEIKSYS